MKFFKKFIFFSFILFPAIFILNIYNSIPSKIIVTQNSEYSLKLNDFCKINSSEKIKAASTPGIALSPGSSDAAILNTDSCGNYDISVKLLNKIPIKTISVTVAPAKYVVPSGDTIGIKLYTNGLLVVSISDFSDSSGKTISPAKSAGLLKGDLITAVNSEPINSSEDFSRKLNMLPAPINLTVCRDDSSLNIEVSPAICADDGKAKLGIWVRDSTAGIGTLTYYDPTTSAFASLGHAICDADTGEIMPVRKGSIMECDILSVTKGKSGSPGELCGSFGSSSLGSISKNSELGIYGKLDRCDKTQFSEAVGVATRFQIKEGNAQILCDIDGNGVKAYNAEIIKVSKSVEISNKGIIIKITDSALLEKTGGIVQGMSGAPIIQNNLLVGAVTHVFINDPTKGYGIFAENMINMTNTID